jgi:tetratricopeptide (TPR) repeat protein
MRKYSLLQDFGLIDCALPIPQVIEMKEIPKNKRYALGWYSEGVTYLSIKEYDEAKEFFEKALNVIPDHPDFLIGYGDVFFARGDFKEAYRYYLSALHAEPDNHKAWMKVGTALLQLRKFREALEIFQNLLELNPYDGEMWYAQGLAFMGLGREDEARGSFSHARRYNPNQPALWYSLSLLEPSPQEAIQLLQRGHHLDSTNLDILQELVRCLLAIGKTDEAIQFCEKARAIAPDNPRTRELLQQCLDKIA